MIELVRPLRRSHDASPFAAARLARQLTVDEAARRAGIPPDHVQWLEDGRVYRFPSVDDALMAALLYASALGVDNREARSLAGLPVPRKPFDPGFRGRVVVFAAAVLAAAGLAGLLLLPGRGGESQQTAGPAAEGAVPELPPPWEISVEVLNGNGDIHWTRQFASQIGALAYQITRVARADRFDYRETAVFYEQGGQAVAVRLAGQLGVTAKPLPGGTDAKRLVVVVGPRRGPGQ